MKKFKGSLVAIASAYLLLSCSKSKEEAETCEDTNTTKVTYSNTTAAALRVVVSKTLTPQLDPIDPIFTIDLAPGQAVSKEFDAGRWITTWYNGCPAGCSRRSYLFKDLEQCVEYEDKQ